MLNFDFIFLWNNATMMDHDGIELPYSNKKRKIRNSVRSENNIRGFKVVFFKFGYLSIALMWLKPNIYLYVSDILTRNSKKT